MLASMIPPRALDAVTATVLRLAWLALHCFFLLRSLGRGTVDRIFHLLGLAFLEPRRGLLYAFRKLHRLMVGRRSAIPVVRRTLLPATHSFSSEKACFNEQVGACGTPCERLSVGTSFA